MARACSPCVHLEVTSGTLRQLYSLSILTMDSKVTKSVTFQFSDLKLSGSTIFIVQDRPPVKLISIFLQIQVPVFR